MGGPQSPLLQVMSPVGTQTADHGAHSPGVSGVGAQAADGGVHLPAGFGSVRPGILVDYLGAH